MIEPIELTSTDTHADERTTLTTMLEYYRAVMVRKAAGLTREQLGMRLEPSTLTIGGLLKHLAYCEAAWFQERLAGLPSPEPWASADWESDPDWELTSGGTDEPGYLIGLFNREVTRSREIVDGFDDLGSLLVRQPKNGAKINLRWLLVHMIEEYARHCGHADLIRESIDGATGD